MGKRPGFVDFASERKKDRGFSTRPSPARSPAEDDRSRWGHFATPFCLAPSPTVDGRPLWSRRRPLDMRQVRPLNCSQASVIGCTQDKILSSRVRAISDISGQNVVVDRISRWGLLAAAPSCNGPFRCRRPSPSLIAIVVCSLSTLVAPFLPFQHAAVFYCRIFFERGAWRPFTLRPSYLL